MNNEEIKKTEELSDEELNQVAGVSLNDEELDQAAGGMGLGSSWIEKGTSVYRL